MRTKRTLLCDCEVLSNDQKKGLGKCCKVSLMFSPKTQNLRVRAPVEEWLPYGKAGDQREELLYS